MAGIVSKNRMAPDGRAYGGKPFARGALYHMLQTVLSRRDVHKPSMRSSAPPLLLSRTTRAFTRLLPLGGPVELTSLSCRAFGQVAILDFIDEVNKTVEVELENEN